MTTLAPHNKVGHPADDLLRAALKHGTMQLHRLAEQAVERMLAHGSAGIVVGQLLTPLEKVELAEVFAAILGTADLLGRALVRDQEQQVLLRHQGQQESRQHESAQMAQVEQIKPWYCGPACLQAVLSRWGIDTYTQENLAHDLGTTEKEGTKPWMITRVAQDLGLDAENRTNLGIDDLIYSTRRGVPVICNVTMHGGGHYVVVTDCQDGQVIYFDPNDGRYHQLDAQEWNHLWYDIRD